MKQRDGPTPNFILFETPARTWRRSTMIRCRHSCRHLHDEFLRPFGSYKLPCVLDVQFARFVKPNPTAPMPAETRSELAVLAQPSSCIADLPLERVVVARLIVEKTGPQDSRNRS